jgi:hypothetical protein
MPIPTRKILCACNGVDLLTKFFGGIEFWLAHVLEIFVVFEIELMCMSKNIAMLVLLGKTCALITLRDD